MAKSFPHYHVNVFYSQEDGGWIAAVPDLQNCSAFGESPEEALRELDTAVGLWLECWMQTHDAPPPVRYQAPPVPIAG